jgi:predicted acyl esterase
MTCPVYAVSGWADRYPDGVLSLLSNYPGPHKALIGPWEHAWPHEAGRGARLDFESEAVRWFDHWLRGIDTGIMDEPRATVWMQEGSERPDPESGRWVSAHEWPPTRPQMLYLSSHTLTAAAQPLSDDVVIDTPVTVGTSGGVSAPLLPGEADQPGDQAPDDDRSVLFDSEPLVEPLDLLGRLRLGVRVTSDRPFGTLAARVTHVSPSGASTLIATGVLSLPLAGDPGASLALEPNQPVHAVVDFLGTGYRVPAGHRLRLALSSGYWPWAWPAPGPFRLTIPRGETPWLELPVLTDAARRSTIPLLDRFVPAVDRGTWVELARLSGNSRTYVTGPDDGEIARRSTVSLSGVPLSGGARFQFDIEETIGLREADPTSASYRSTLRAELERADWHPRVRVECSLAGGKESFELRMELHAQEEDSAVDVTRVWETSIPRALL